MLLRRHSKDDNFIEKRRVWRSQLDQRIGPSMLATVLPAIVMCLFLVLAAPFLTSLANKFLGVRESDVEVVRIETAEETQPVEELVPPPNPELAEAEFYRKHFDSIGFDWRKKPELEEPPVEQDLPTIELKPIDSELRLSINSPPEASSSKSE